MVDELLKKEIREKLKRHLDGSYVVMSVGELRELIPELIDLVEVKKLSQGPEPPKLITTTEKNIEEPKPLIGKDEIITIAELEQRLIDAAMKKTVGCVRAAAKELEISERTLRRKFADYEINPNTYRKNIRSRKEN